MPTTNLHLKFIVLDSSALISDYWLRSPSFVLLRDFLKKSSATLVVPRIVLEEVTNHHREDFEEVKSDLQKNYREVARLLPGFTKTRGLLGEISKIDLKTPYPQYLADELGKLKAHISDYRSIPHEIVVGRALRRKRPFQPNGKGYRDALIWECILRDCVKEVGDTVLITNNRLDFCDTRGELHSDLQKEVQNKVGKYDRLLIYKDVAEFTDAHIVPFLKERGDFEILVRTKMVSGLDLKTVCDENTDLLIQAIDASPRSMFADPGDYDPTVDVVEIPNEIEVLKASEISTDVLLVVLKFRAGVAIEYLIPKSEYYLMDDEDRASIAIIDSDWNEWSMHVESITQIDLTCRLTFNTVKQIVESFEVERVEAVDEVP
jgi:PIN domain